jgi:hypothetical protein
MRTRNLLLPLAVVLVVFAAVSIVLPTLAMGRSAVEQAGDELPGKVEIFVLPNGEVQILPGPCPDCDADPETEPIIWPTRPFTLSGPYALPPIGGGGLEVEPQFETIMDTALSGTVVPGALVLDDIASVECVSAAPSDAVTAVSLVWNGPLDCAAIEGAMPVYHALAGAPLTAVADEFVHSATLAAGELTDGSFLARTDLPPSTGRFADTRLSLRIGEDGVIICTNCHPDPEPVPVPGPDPEGGDECTIWSCCEQWPLGVRCLVAEGPVDDAVLESAVAIRRLLEAAEAQR